MKKLLSFTFLFLPWIISFILLPFSNIKPSLYLLYYIFISFLFYIYISLFIYNKLKESRINNTFNLLVLILYILNQTFNILILYYNYYFLSLFIGIFSLVSLILLNKFYNK